MKKLTLLLFVLISVQSVAQDFLCINYEVDTSYSSLGSEYYTIDSIAPYEYEVWTTTFIESKYKDIVWKNKKSHSIDIDAYKFEAIDSTLSNCKDTVFIIVHRRYINLYSEQCYKTK
jgi:hypothetical protein